jgi:hypothetical protein
MMTMIRPYMNDSVKDRINLGYEALLNKEVAQIPRPVAHEAESMKTLTRVRVDEPVSREEVPKRRQGRRKTWRRINISLR